MEPWTFLLGIAQAVLVRVISDLINGRTKKVRREDIRKEVVHVLGDRSQLDAPDRMQTTSEVLKEIDEISRRNPDLKVNEGDIELTKPSRRPRFLITPWETKKKLRNRLYRLDEIISKRRQELDSSPPPEGEKSQLKSPPPLKGDEVSIDLSPPPKHGEHRLESFPTIEEEKIRLEPVGKRKSPSPWMLELEERIQIRRERRPQ